MTQTSKNMAQILLGWFLLASCQNPFEALPNVGPEVNSSNLVLTVSLDQVVEDESRGLIQDTQVSSVVFSAHNGSTNALIGSAINLTKGVSSWSGSFDALPGAGTYHFLAKALDSGGKVLYSGAALSQVITANTHLTLPVSATRYLQIAYPQGWVARTFTKIHIAGSRFQNTDSTDWPNQLPSMEAVADNPGLWRYPLVAGEASFQVTFVWQDGGQTAELTFGGDTQQQLTWEVTDAANGVWNTLFPATLSEGWETGNFSSQKWTLVSTGTATPKPTVAITTSQFQAGTHSAEFPTRYLYSGQNVLLSLEVQPAQTSTITFYLKTDIGTDVSTEFQFLVDGVVKGTWNGLGQPWVQVSYPLTAAKHTLLWKAIKNTNSYYPSATNSVFLDGITLVADSSVSVEVSPKVTQTYAVGGAGAQFSSQSLRGDGSIKTGPTYTWTVESLTEGGTGSIDTQGNFLPTVAGTCRVKSVSSEGLTGYSGTITILPSNYLRLPFIYKGTTYQGMTTAGTGNPKTSSPTEISISWPTTASFDADAFFTLEGSVTQPTVYNYTWVKVIKDATSQETTYFLRNQFASRIWLRFGSGTYTVKVYKLSTFAPDISGEGDYNGWSYSTTPVYTFTVNNTNSESGTFLYPSDPIQSDDLKILNLASQLTSGLTQKTDIIKALHDYVVQLLHYDNDSLVAGQRKKQDALSTLSNKTGVCEGYTSLFTALLRTQGIVSKAVAGSVPGGLHAWTVLDLNGTWYFADSTWADPYPAGDNRISYTYYMLTSMTGVNGDHTQTDERVGRSLLGSQPTWRGRPNGWY